MTVHAPATVADARTGELFGHPKGLAFLFATEMWERFSYYGMRALLVLYMMKYLLLADRAETVVGLTALRRALEWLFGPLDIQPLASQIYGFYTGLVYLTPILGGLLADRVLGQRRTVVVGAVLMAIGHFMMAFEALFLFALLALILGNGAFKPNISTQVGGLYAAGDRRRDRAFSIFYVGINLGAFLAPLVCGTLGEAAGWHYGFAAAGVGMTLGLAIYLYAVPTLPPDALAQRMAAGEARRFGREEWRAILALLILSLPVTFYWATYEQQGNTIALWADQYTDRAIDLKFFETEIPTTWFQAFNPFMIFAFTPLIVALWGWQGARGSEPSTVSKMAIGCFLNAASYLILFVAAWHSGDAKASWLWLLAYFIVITIGELYLSPTALALVSKVAPAGFLSMMMGVWLATSFYGGFLAGYLGSFWSGMAKQDFFLMIAIIAALAGVAVVSFHRPLKAILKE
ncbi:MAG: peptide MFS transporter [Xanthobacteraceae bacterium]|jgi:proton-dependent oligopeptide transporter, POT family